MRAAAGGGVWRSLVGRLREAVLGGRRGYAGDGGREGGRAGRGGRRGGGRRGGGGGGGRAEGSQGRRGGRDGGRDGRGGRFEGWWGGSEGEGAAWGGSGGGRGSARGGRGRGWGRGGARGPDIGADVPGEESAPAEQSWWSARWRRIRGVSGGVLEDLDDVEAQLQRLRRIQRIPDVAAEVWTSLYEAAVAMGLVVAGAYAFIKTKAEKLKEKLSPRKTRPEDGGDVIEPIGPLEFSP